MKKLLSVFLAFCLVLSTVTTLAMGTETTIDFEDVSKWILNSEGENIDGREGSKDKASWASITANTNTDFIKEGGSSLKVYNNFQFSSFKLEGLKPNTEYILTYDHYVPTLYVTKAGVTYNHGIEYTGIFMPDFDGASVKNNKDGWLDRVNTSAGRTTPDGIYANGTNDARKTSGITAAAWYTVKHTFNTGNYNNLYLFIKANAEVLYLDNFVLTEVAVTENESKKAENLIINGDFADDSNVDTTTKNYKGTAENFGKWINFNTGILNYAYSKDGGVNGSGAALATVPSTGYVRSFGQVLNISKNTNYILTFKSKGNLSGKVNGGAFKVQPCHAMPEYALNTNAVTAVAETDDWKEYTINFNSGNAVSTWVGFGGMYDSEPGLYYYIDDVGLYEADKVSKVGATATEGGTVSGDGYYNRGKTATLIATPLNGYNFEGWYLGESLVSDSLSFEVIASADGTALEYVAKFSQKANDPDELLFDGGFDLTDKMSSAESYDTVTYDSAHIWYKPSSSSSIENLDGNKVLKLSSWAYQSVKLSVGTSYTLKFRAKNTIEGLQITPYIRNLKNRGTIVKMLSKIAVESNDSWADYSITFKLDSIPSDVTDLTLGLHCGDGNHLYIDDISLKAVEVIPEKDITVSVVSDGGGSATADKTTVKKGETVTFTATPFKDFGFAGWFRDGENAAVSTDLVYTVTAEENIYLHAKFTYNGVVDPDELLFDGGFNFTDKLVSAESYDTVTYESAHIWYKPPTGSEIAEDNGNKVLNLKTWVYQSVKVEEKTSYVLRFSAKADKETSIQAFVRPIKNRAVIFVTSDNTATIVGDGNWHDYTLLVKIPTFLSNYTDYGLALKATDGTSALVDDISFKKLTDDMVTVSTSTFRGGSASASVPIALAGDKVTFTATPDDGNTFEGWYVKGSIYLGAISTEKVFTTAVTEDIDLLAVFGGKQYPSTTYSWINPDAETGDTTGWHTINSGAVFGVEKDRVFDGDYSFILEKEENQRAAVMTNDGILLKGNHHYAISFYLYNNRNIRLRPFLSTSPNYSESISDLVYQDGDKIIRDDLQIFHTVGNDPPLGRYFSSMLLNKSTGAYSGSKDGWVKYTMEFDLLPQYDGTVVYLGIQCRTGEGVAQFDNLEVVEEKLNLDPQNSDMLYGEWVYNRFENGDFEEEVQLPSGFEISDDAFGGKGALKVSSGAGVYVKKLSLTRNEWFCLNYVIKANKSGSSYLGIALEEPSADTDFADPEKSNIFAFYPSTKGEWVRSAIKFTPQISDDVYLVIYGGSNEMLIDDINLFAEKHARETDPNNPTLLPAYDYNNDVYYDKYDLMYSQSGQVDTDASPETGDTVYPIALVIITFVAAAVMTVAKKSKRRAK